jgi:hypothetical protein
MEIKLDMVIELDHSKIGNKSEDQIRLEISRELSTLTRKGGVIIRFTVEKMIMVNRHAQD